MACKRSGVRLPLAPPLLSSFPELLLSGFHNNPFPRTRLAIHLHAVPGHHLGTRIQFRKLLSRSFILMLFPRAATPQTWSRADTRITGRAHWTADVFDSLLALALSCSGLLPHLHALVVVIGQKFSATHPPQTRRLALTPNTIPAWADCSRGFEVDRWPLRAT